MAVTESSYSTGSSEDVIIETHDVSVYFEMDRGTSKVLDDVSLDIYREEILGIVGESGSGKSMFASALLDAVVAPGKTSGDILYHDADGSTIDVLSLNQEELRAFRWEKVSMVFQGAMDSFNPTLRIKGHFIETLKAHDFDVDEGLERATDLLAQVYLDPDRVLSSYPHELSGGMKQRVLIALSLLLDPDVLVMDEPTAALDLLMQRSILRLLENLQQRYDLTVLFITHDLPLVAELSDRVAVLYAFQFVEVGPVSELLERSSHPYTRALLNAVPTLQTPLSDMEPIEGSSPDPINVPTGCSYHPRCPLADERCIGEEPPFYATEHDDHQTKCFHWEDAISEIPLAHHKSTTGSSQIVEGKQSEEPVLTLDNLCVHFENNNSFLGLFGESQTVFAVDEIDLDLYENDILAIVGESGCGKTTLGKASIALQRPTSGEVQYRGDDIWAVKDGRSESDRSYSAIRRALQIIHQDPGSSLNPNQKILRTLESPIKHWKSDMSQTDRRSQIYGLLEYVGLTPAEEYAQRYPHQLSGGEKQRVALTRALLMNPEVILADEAVSALDVSLRVEMMDMMISLQNMFDTSYIFISHDLANARYFAGSVGGRIAVMYLGEIVEIGPAEEVIQNPKHPYTKVLKWSTAELDSDASQEELPLRNIDIPDPVNPPSGCRFHTRCPEARTECRVNSPKLEATDDGDGIEAHQVACFLDKPRDHPYWSSDQLVSEDNPTLVE